MTKKELLKALEPFDDEIEILFVDPEIGDLYKAESEYRVLRDGEGVFLIWQGDFKELL